MKKQFEEFRLVKYRFILKPVDFIKLSNFAGSSLRKDFIPVFKQLSCLEPHGECKICKLQKECPYFVSLEIGEGVPDPEYKRYQTPPKPFIFEPPLKRKSFYSKNEELYFDLIMFGQPMKFFPNFITAIRRIGEVGIGRNRGKYVLNRILCFDLVKEEHRNIYSSDTEISKYEDDSVSLSELFEKFECDQGTISEMNVSIVSPLRMKRLGNENWHLYFKTLMKNILTRIANIAYSYCGYEEFLHFPEVIYNAGAVRTIRENLVWEDWRSPALRDKKPNIRLGGFVGDIVYKGEISEFWPIVKIGEIIHVGKNTSFGLGRILAEPVVSEPQN